MAWHVSLNVLKRMLSATVRGSEEMGLWLLSSQLAVVVTASLQTNSLSVSLCEISPADQEVNRVLGVLRHLQTGPSSLYLCFCELYNIAQPVYVGSPARSRATCRIEVLAETSTVVHVHLRLKGH